MPVPVSAGSPHLRAPPTTYDAHITPRSLIETMLYTYTPSFIRRLEHFSASVAVFAVLPLIFCPIYTYLYQGSLLQFCVHM